MRTTIELKDEQRAALLELAAQRGEKGFSHLVAEAVDYYLREVEDRKAKQQRARLLKGTFSDEEADELRALVRESRAHWRS